MSKKRLISNAQALKYYNLLKEKVIKNGCSVKEVKDAGDANGIYYPEYYLIEVQKSTSAFLMLILLAHEFGHFIEHITVFKHYGRNAYHRFIRKGRFRRADYVLSEACAWIVAEDELNKIDRSICLDYRFPKYRAVFMDVTINNVYRKRGT